MEIPQIGLGTWELRGEKCRDVVKMALEIGYRHFDTAHIYGNHQAIAKAITGFDRSKIYLTSKLALQDQVHVENVEGSVRAACSQALQELGTDYLDLYLIHMPDQSYPLERIFEVMQVLADEGKIHKAGVSNYTINRLDKLVQAGLVPYANQVEFHPYLNQTELLSYCVEHHIRLISYRSFGKGQLLKDEPLFDQIGEKYNKLGAQVILRWLIQKGIAVIPKASSEEHLRSNFAVFDFSLSEEEMLQINGLSQNKRYCAAGFD